MSDPLEPLKEAAKAAEPLAKDISPTGLPLLPAKAVPVVGVVLALAIAVSQLAPEHTLAHKAALAVLGLASLLGLASPGLRVSKKSEE